MKGRRAPELAAGDLERILQQGLAGEHAALTRRAAQLDQVGRGRVFGDLERAKSNIKLGLQLKLSYAQSVPFLLAGIAHHDLPTARDCARRCVAQFDSPAAGHEQQSSTRHHRLSGIALQPGSAIRKDIQKFLGGGGGGAGLHQRAALQGCVLKLKFTMVTERSVDRLHAMGKSGITKAPHHSESFFSLAVRKRELERLLEDRPDVVKRMVDVQDRLRTPEVVGGALNMQHHPSDFEIIRSGELAMKDLQKIVYRCDLK